MKLYFENRNRIPRRKMNEDYMIEIPTGDVIRLTDKQYNWADRIIDCLDLGDDEDAMTEVQMDLAQGRASKYLDKLEGKAPKRTIDAFKSFLGHESKKRMSEELDDEAKDYIRNASIDDLLDDYYDLRRNDRYGVNLEELKAVKAEIKSRCSH